MHQYIVDAFTNEVFKGNPAAVCLPKVWPDEQLMKNIARENALSETAFIVKEEDGYRLRWFTPTTEIDLCGHATLASAFVIMTQLQPKLNEVSFNTRSGVLTVRRRGSFFELDFPAFALHQVKVTSQMQDAIGGAEIEDALMGRDLLLILKDEKTVRELCVDQAKVKALPGVLLHVTSAGKDFDCVSRSFAPKHGIAEDPVCGIGHCHIAPYWFARLDKNELLAQQASLRSGVLKCINHGERLSLCGEAVLFGKTEFNVD